MRKRKFMQLLFHLSNPKCLFAFFAWRPFSITSFLMMRKIKKMGIPFRGIIDGGANVGQFSRAAAENFPGSWIIAFEPLPDVAEEFREKLSDQSHRVRMIQTALGRKEGVVSFHRNSFSLSSSVLPLSENHRRAFPFASDVSKVTVPISTLDKALKKENLEGPILLKLDLQGFELEALRGGVATLQKVDAILLESSIKPMYKGEPSFKKIKAFLDQKGFNYSQDLDFLKDFQGNILQMDALFLRKKAKK